VPSFFVRRNLRVVLLTNSLEYGIIKGDRLKKKENKKSRVANSASTARGSDPQLHGFVFHDYSPMVRTSCLLDPGFLWA
jgi:hypothetical protein